MKSATKGDAKSKEPTKSITDSFKSASSSVHKPPPLAAAGPLHAKSIKPRIMQNFLLVWLDANIDQSNPDYCNSMNQLHKVVNHINTIREADRCMDFLDKIKDEKVFMIVSGSLGQTVVPKIHNMHQLHSIFVFCCNIPYHEQWTKNYPKVKGVINNVDKICDWLRQAAYHCDQELTPMGFVSADVSSSNHSLNELDQSFMYTQLFKEILLEIEYDTVLCVKELAAYCREQYANNQGELTKIAEFERDYRPHKCIWWYTYDCFLYRMLNRALRTLEVDTILKMGFFIQHLHRHIARLHSEQPDNFKRKPFVVYRGQGLSKVDFEKVKNTKGGLLSFNNFLSTSQKADVSMDFARQTLSNIGLFGIFFHISIDPSISSTPYALVKNQSFFSSEEEILFSMHMVFRINEIERLDENNRLWRVKLSLTADNDQQLSALTKRLQQETRMLTGWDRLGRLLLQLGQFDKVEQIYRNLLDQPSDSEDRGSFYQQLGNITKCRGQYPDAIVFHKKALEIHEKILPPLHPLLAIHYRDIADLYKHVNEKSQALRFCEKAIKINKKILPETHPQLAEDYASIGEAYFNLENYSKSAHYSQKAYEVHQKTLPAEHCQLAIDCKILANVYNCMGDFDKAMTFREKALAIDQKILPPTAHQLAIDYNMIGTTYRNMSQFEKALASHEKAIQIYTQTLPLTHPILAITYAFIGLVHESMGQFLKALSYYQRVFDINKTALSLDHPALAADYNNIGRVYQELGDYSKALSAHEKSLEIRQKGLPPDHIELVFSYTNLGSIYRYMGEFSKALFVYEKAANLQRQILSSESAALAMTYHFMGTVYDAMGDYQRALSLHQKALEIQQKALPPYHQDFAFSYLCLGWVHKNMGQYATALSFYEKNLDVNYKQKQIIPRNVAAMNNNIGELYCKMQDYPKAMEYLGKAIEVFSKTLPPNHSDSAECYNNIGDVQKNLRQYSKALSSYQRAVDIGQRTLPPNHPDLRKWRRNLEAVKNKV